jgi:DNA repair exonuclease SbcCD ATPase subunit
MGLTSTEQARATVAQLEEKLADASARAVELQTERRKLSFDANTGDDSARKRLDKLNAQSATIDLEIENMRSAIEEARRRLADAQRAEGVALLAKNAAEATKLADAIAEHGQRADAAFATAAAELEALKTKIDELHRLGVTYPRAEQFAVLGGLALMTAVTTLPLKVDRSHLAPRERQTFTELSATWRTQVMRWAQPFLAKEAA